MADETESLWLFMKWLVADLSYLWLLEAAHIPWLEFGPSTQITFFSFHAIMNALLMFRIPIPFLAWLGALTNYLWDSELAISGASVKYSNVVNNPSLILGKQIIHVLPEGYVLLVLVVMFVTNSSPRSALLNPDRIPLCLDTSRSSSSVALPLRINQTTPISIDLVRYDLDTPFNETLTISASQAKRLRKDAMRGHDYSPSDPVTLQLPVKKPGLYRLHRMIDETRMDVQLRASSEALIVNCPSASIASPSVNRCRGDLSNLAIEVNGTPPLRVKYRKAVNGKESEMSYQSIQPEDFVSPLARHREPGPVMAAGDQQLFWANSHHVRVPLNESLDSGGQWSYFVDEVTDALANVISYTPDEEQSKPRAKASEQNLVVHDRPRASLQGQDLQRPLRVAKGHTAFFPIHVSSTKKSPMDDTEHLYTYRFTPIDEIPESGEHGIISRVHAFSVKSVNSKHQVREPGLYTLLSVRTPYCDGDVLEPSSFLFTNPPEPDLSIDPEVITDRCAGRAIGFRVGLDLLGTPPFRVQYLVKQKGRRQAEVHTQGVRGMRDQIEFKPTEAGHYTYTLTEVSDSVYNGISLKPKGLELSHDVKPAVSASFVDSSPKRRACIDEPASFDVRFQGEGPWHLDYEIVHSGRRTKQRISEVEEDHHTITTPPLSNGGEYSIVLTGVTDKDGCRETLQQDAKVQVRHQRPKAAFGLVEGQSSLRTLEGKYVDIPLRLSGEGPWTVDYQFHDRQNTTRTHTKEVKSPNDLIRTKDPGHYEILRVRDAVCPGVVEGGANRFDISWIGRPVVSVNPNTVLRAVDDHYERRAICEGEEDAFEVFLNGRPPYDVSYVERVSYAGGQTAVRPKKELHVPLNSAQIKMDSSQAGTYTYTFSELGDYNYDHDPRQHKALKVQQNVLGRPTIAFKEPGKVYSICQSQDRDAPAVDEQSIPIRFPTGEPPFSFDLEITRPGRGARPELLSFQNADTRDFSARLPSARLPPGNSIVSLRRVRDAKGCERNILPNSPESGRVQISVHDVPNVTPVEARQDFCVGERIAFALSGMAPYTILYAFEGKTRKATETTPTFRRLAEQPGTFTITSVQDSNSACKRATHLTKTIHPYPSVRVSKGKESRVDIHAGGTAEITFDFGGSPPFTFTYTRSENVGKSDRKKGQVLETKTLTSQEKSLSIQASDEGTYEVVAIKDAFCHYAMPGSEALLGGARMITNE